MECFKESDLNRSCSHLKQERFRENGVVGKAPRMIYKNGKKEKFLEEVKTCVRLGKERERRKDEKGGYEEKGKGEGRKGPRGGGESEGKR